MKKILFTIALLVGFITINHAQSLRYNLTNASMETWDFMMMNNGSSGMIYEMSIEPGKNRVGTVSGFEFPIEFKVENSQGCGTSQFIPRPVPFMGEQIECTEQAEIKYRVEEIIPFLVYQMDLYFG